MNKLEQTLTSMEVAEMIGKEHHKLMRDIRTYIEQLGESKVGFTDFFTESEYLSSQNKKLPCYLITKKGCEFVSHKLTGTKGTEFTAKYINRFHDMEKVIQDRVPAGKEFFALAVLEAQKIIEDQSQRIEEMAPKALFADAVAGSSTSILIGDLAKLLKQNGVNIGQNRLFEWMRNNGYLYQSKADKQNRAYQRHIEQGLFEIKETVISTPDKEPKIRFTIKVTGKGQQYFINKFLKEESA